MRKRVPFYTKVDLRDAMKHYQQAQIEYATDIQRSEYQFIPAHVVRAAIREIAKVLSRVPQYKGHSSLAKLKRVSGWKEMEAALDDVWAYAERRRVLLIA
jgi:predicted transcriptional regulator